jgi:hypothetical protein
MDDHYTIAIQHFLFWKQQGLTLDEMLAAIGARVPDSPYFVLTAPWVVSAITDAHALLGVDLSHGSRRQRRKAA